MSLAFLDINESNLQLWHRDQRLQSPGYVLARGQQYIFGTAARATARLQPRDINSRYWWQLNTQPLQPALGPARHTADLVHAHLLALYEEAGKPDEMLLAVSPSMEREQLALLLGIVQACPFDAVGLVNRSVALASLYPVTGRVFHLEMQLHQAVLSELGRSDDEVNCRRTVPLPGCGMLQLQERLVEIIAAAFIRQTRFDPRRKASSEQQLYDALPAALRSLHDAAETSLEVNGYHARITRRELEDAGNRLVTSAGEVMGSQQSGDQLLLDPIAQLLPGLERQLPGVTALDPEAIHQALQQHQQRLLQHGEAINFIVSLPVLASAGAEAPVAPAATTPNGAPTATSTPAATATASVPPPTHVLADGRARPLAPAGTALGSGWEAYHEDHQWQLRGSELPAPRINGQSYQSGQVLACGDRIVLPGQPELQLIAVLGSET